MVEKFLTFFVQRVSAVAMTILISAITALAAKGWLDASQATAAAEALVAVGGSLLLALLHRAVLSPVVRKVLEGAGKVAGLDLTSEVTPVPTKEMRQSVGTDGGTVGKIGMLLLVCLIPFSLLGCQTPTTGQTRPDFGALVAITLAQGGLASVELRVEKAYEDHKIDRPTYLALRATEKNAADGLTALADAALAGKPIDDADKLAFANKVIRDINTALLGGLPGEIPATQPAH